MSDWTVVALEKVLARDLPVRGDLPVGPVVEGKRIDVDAGCGDALRDLTEQFGQRLRSAVEVDEAERSPALQADRNERDVGDVDALALRPRRGVERPVERVRPGVVRALKTLPAAWLLDDDRAAVPADVDERALVPMLVSHDDDRHPPRPPRHDVLLAEDADVLPRPPEDRLLLARQHRRLAVPPPRRRRRGVQAASATIAITYPRISSTPVARCSWMFFAIAGMSA